MTALDDDDDDNVAPPQGVKLRNPDDTDGIREDIEQGVMQAMQKYVHGYEYGGTRLELSDLSYKDQPRYSLAEQREALMKDSTLARRLRGTVSLVDVATNKPLEVRKNMTLARVPYLTQRGTMIHNGSEYAPASQSRLLPGAYTRKTNNGTLECFHKSTRIWTEHGMLPIGKIVDERMSVRVWSYDFDAGAFVLKPVVNWYKNQTKAGLGRATYDANGRCPTLFSNNRGRLWVTPTHNFMEVGGGKREVQEDSLPLLMVEENPSGSQEQVILGSLLGDGFLSRDGIFQEAHCEVQRPYLAWKAAVMAPFVKDGVKQSKPSKSAYGSAPSVAKLFTLSCAFLRRLREAWYPAGDKTLSVDLLQRVDARGLAVWFQDDGCAFLADNGGGATSCQVVDLATLGFSKSCVDVLVTWLGERWGVRATPTEHKDARRPAASNARQWSLKMYGSNAERFLDLVAPYIHQSMLYKLPPRPPAGRCDDCGAEQIRLRKRCNRCWLDRFRSSPHLDTRGLRKRFGGMGRVRELAAGATLPPDEVPGARWDARMLSAGSLVGAMTDDSVPELVLREVDYKFDSGRHLKYGNSKFAYDIEVADTHNYVAHGVLVSNCHFNTRPGTGSAMRVSLDPVTGQYRLRVGTSNVHAYSVFKDLGVTDEEMTKRWGPEILDVNRADYDSRAIDRVYLKAIPKWQRDPALSKEAKAVAVAEAFGRAQVAKAVMQENLPSLFSREKAASWRVQGLAMEKLAKLTTKTTHELVFGPSGGGKTTKATQLAAETGLPVVNIDDAPEWRNFVRANDYNRDAEGKLIHTIDGTPQNEAWKALMRTLSERALALKDPHIIEGTHLMMLNPAELRGHNLHLVNPSLATVKAQRIARSQLSRKELGRPELTKADIQERERLAEDLYNSAQPAAKVWESIKSGKPAMPLAQPEPTEEPARQLSLADATRAILLKRAAASPVQLKPTVSPTAHHRYLADDDEHETYAPIGIDGLLASTEKLLAVNRGLEQTDHRDAASNDRIYTVDRLMAERVKLDHGKTLRTLMGRLSRRKNLSALGPAAFDAYTVDYLKGNPTAGAIEEINPMSIMEQRRRITKMGPGGIGDPNAITMSMQAVDASQFGFISTLEGPESEKAGIDVRLSYGARIGSDGRIYQMARNLRTGKKEWISPSSLKGKTLRLPD